MIKNKIEIFIHNQADRLNLFLPVCFALGIICYFTLPFEPKLWIGIFLFGLTIGLFIFIKNNLRLLFLILIFFFAGFVRINLQTKWVSAPFIHKKYTVTITGKIEKVEKFINAERITLTDLIFDKLPDAEKPFKIRIRINGLKQKLKYGDVVLLKATLLPPTLPFLPDSYPYSRSAFYNQIGATGYAISPIKIIEQTKENTSVIQQIRSSIREHIVRVLPIEQASIATALITGDQGLVSEQQRHTYTAAGIVHILSVSGFHMTLIAGFIFFFFRWLLMLFTKFAATYNTNKISAVLALLITFLYLLISGMAIPAVRSFGMIALVLLGVIFDRRAISLHSVFWIAFLILMFSPQSLMTAGFALSFIAVITLVGFHEMLYRKTADYFSQKSFLMKKVVFPLFIIFAVNFIVHFATAPVVIYHFHRYANYTIIGNFLTAPVFSFLIMPILFCATILIPFGISYPLFWIVGVLLYSVDLICKWLSTLPLSNIYTPPLTDYGYALFIIGCLTLFVLKGKIKWISLIFMLCGASSFLFYQTPDILVNQGGNLWAIKKNNQYVFSSMTKYKSTKNSWLEMMGISPTTKVKKDDSVIQTVKGLRVRFDGNAGENADIVFNTKPFVACSNKICIPRQKLWKEGTHAVYITEKNIKIKTAAEQMKNRPWSQGLFIRTK